MYNIFEISDLENSLIKDAPLNYGKHFENTNKLVSLVSNFYTKEIDFNYWIFYFFTTQIQNSLLLSLLSTLRKHDVQTNMMLRQALESLVLACYAAYNNNMDNFGYITPDGFLKANKNLRNTAYTWFNKKYEGESNIIKFSKDLINDTSSHSNIYCIFNNSEFKNKTILTNFFDNDSEIKDFEVKQRLWWIGDISFGTINLLSQVINDLKIGELIDGLNETLTELKKDNITIMNELKQNSIFQKNQ